MARIKDGDDAATMGSGAPVAEYQPRVEVEDDDGDDNHATALASEDTPLLPTDLPEDIVPDKTFQRWVIAMCVGCVFIIELGFFVLEPPMEQVMEDVICRYTYPDHLLWTPQVIDDRCKSAKVQKELAMLVSWQTSASMFVPILVQIPYGIIADKYGRRPVLFLALFGIVASTVWQYLVLLRPDIFSIWAMIPSNALFLIGGGAPMVLAMIWTILCDVIPSAGRTSVFYQLHAMTLILSAIVRPITGWLQSISPWVPMWFGLGTLLVGLASSLFIPETLTFRKEADERRLQANQTEAASRENSDGQDRDRRVHKIKAVKRAWSMMKGDTAHIWKFLLSTKPVVLLFSAFAFTYPIVVVFAVHLLQYLSKRFNWAWATATYATTAEKAGGTVTLLVILPLAAKFLTKRYGMGPLHRDHLLTRVSICFITLACVLTGLAPTPWLVVGSLVIYSLGAGFQPQIRALLSGIVEPHMLATMNTMVSMLEAIMGFVSAPALGWLMSHGIDMGGPWIGLPFLAAAVCGVIVFCCLLAFRIPGGYERDRADAV